MPIHRARAAIERAHRALGLTYSEIARALGANSSTLHRWRSGASTPTGVFRTRCTALNDLVDVLEQVNPDPTESRNWLEQPLHPLSGKTPHEVLLAGRPDLLTGLLLARGATVRMLDPSPPPMSRESQGSTQ